MAFVTALGVVLLLLCSARFGTSRSLEEDFSLEKRAAGGNAQPPAATTTLAQQVAQQLVRDVRQAAQNPRRRPPNGT
jgi:hypothetical protein